MPFGQPVLGTITTQPSGTTLLPLRSLATVSAPCPICETFPVNPVPLRRNTDFGGCRTDHELSVMLVPSQCNVSSRSLKHCMTLVSFVLCPNS